MDLVGKVFGRIERAVSDIVGGITETIEDVASDVRPGTIQTAIAPEISTAAQVANFAFDYINSQSRSRIRSQQPPILEENPQMPHTEGHSDGELMVGGIGLENGNLGANVVAFGTQALQNLGRNALRNIGRGGFGGGVVGGMAGGALMDSMNDNCNSCAPKPFVRLNNCGQPIITRKMKKTAIEAVNCNGSEAAAAALTGGSMELLTTIISKQFPPMRRGISGAQLNNAARTARKLNRMHEQFQKMCKKPTRKR